MTEQPPKRTRGKSKPKKLDKPALIAAYALERAKGTTKKAAADKLQISRRQVYHLEESAPDLLNDLIITAGEQLARQALPQAVQVIEDTLTETIDQGVTGIYWYERTPPATIDDQGQVTDQPPPELVAAYDPDLHKAQLGLRKLGISAADSVLKATGVLSTPTASPVIQNLTIKQTNLLLPAVRNVLTALSVAALDDNEESDRDVTP